MTAVLQSAARIARSPAVFENVRSQDCNLAIWERPALEGVDALIRGGVKDVRFEVDLAKLEAILCGELQGSGFGWSPALDALVTDIADLSERYCNILSLDRLELRLELVTTDSCRKFHADYVKARLITTYVGTGTQWLDEEDAHRVGKGLEPRTIRELATGDVGIFKGRLATEAPAIHRSPPISGSGQQRLLLVLNPAQEG